MKSKSSKMNAKDKNAFEMLNESKINCSDERDTFQVIIDLGKEVVDLRRYARALEDEIRELKKKLILAEDTLEMTRQHNGKLESLPDPDDSIVLLMNNMSNINPKEYTNSFTRFGT